MSAISRDLDDTVRRVVLLPGAAGAASFWEPIIERLSASWHVQAIDLPGLGFVPASPDVRSYDDLVDHVARAIAAPTAVVVAQSMGTYVALQLALRYPHLVTHLVLVAASGGIDVGVHGAKDWRQEYASAFPPRSGLGAGVCSGSLRSIE